MYSLDTNLKYKFNFEIKPARKMGGCRCVFRDCEMSSYRNRNISFFHFPLKEPQRYDEWLKYSKAEYIKSLPESKQKNRVICARHFRDECFMNYKKNSLTKLAIPTVWRLSKYTTIDYKDNIEVGRLIILNQLQTQSHLKAPPGFICPLAFSDDDDAVITRKLIDIGFSLDAIDSYNKKRKIAEVADYPCNEKFECLNNMPPPPPLIKKRRHTMVDTEQSNRHKTCLILNGSRTSLPRDDHLIYTFTNITDLENVNVAEKSTKKRDMLPPLTSPPKDNIFTLVSKDLFKGNDATTGGEKQMVLLYDEADQTIAVTLNNEEDDDDNEKLTPNDFESVKIKKEKDEKPTYTESEKLLMERVKILENKVTKLSVDLSKRQFTLKTKQLELNALKTKNTELEQQKNRNFKIINQHIMIQKDLEEANEKLREQLQQLQNQNKELSEKLEKLQQTQQQECTITTTDNNNTDKNTAAAANNLNKVNPSAKIQHYNGIKRYIGVAMTSLLRMEMFGNSDRPWKADERLIAVDILRLGEEVYKYMIEEWRLRLPPIADTKRWMLESIDNNNDFENEENI